MNQIQISARPAFTFELDAATVTAIRTMAINHYDLMCKGAAYQGGMIFGWWHNLKEVDQASEKEFIEVCLDFRQIDLLSKILENRGVLEADEYKLVANLRGLIALAINKFQIESQKFHFTVIIQ